MMGGQQIIILKEGTEREKGKGAVFNNIAAARAVADAVKSTLGPEGMDHIHVGPPVDVRITNDGVTILKEIEIEHPTAKMLVEVAKTQDDEVGDGTTSAVILAGELLKEAESLIEQEVHPTLIVNGYRMAAAEAVKLLRELAFAVKRTDKDTLRSIRRSSRCSSMKRRRPTGRWSTRLKRPVPTSSWVRRESTTSPNTSWPRKASTRSAG